MWNRSNNLIYLKYDYFLKYIVETGHCQLSFMVVVLKMMQFKKKKKALVNDAQVLGIYDSTALFVWLIEETEENVASNGT